MDLPMLAEYYLDRIESLSDPETSAKESLSDIRLLICSMCRFNRST